MKTPKGKKSAPAASLSKKAEETNLKKKTKTDRAPKRQSGKDSKAKKDPNKPKKPPSAFFVFLEEFRKTYQAENPGVKSVAVIGKAGGGKWNSLSETEKAPYAAKAAKRKAEYEKCLQAYNQKADGGAADESDKSKSEINDEEEGSAEDVDEDDDDDE